MLRLNALSLEERLFTAESFRGSTEFIRGITHGAGEGSYGLFNIPQERVEGFMAASNRRLNQIFRKYHTDPYHRFPVYYRDYNHFAEEFSPMDLVTEALPGWDWSVISPAGRERMNRALLVARLVKMEKGDRQIVDSRRYYSDQYAFFHAVSAGMLTMYLLGERGYFMFAHDTVEEAPSVRSAYEDAKACLLDIRATEGNLDRAVKRLMDEHHLFCGNGSDGSRGRDIGKMYWAARHKALDSDIEFILGSERTDERKRLRASLNSISKNPGHAIAIGRYYSDYLTPLFSDPDLVVGKMSDMLHNASTQFDFRKDTRRLTKRLESFIEIQQMLDMAKYYMREVTAQHLMSTGQLEPMDYQLFKFMLADPSMRERFNESYARTVSLFEHADIERISEQVPQFSAIYMLHSALTSVVKRDLQNLTDFVTDKFLRARVGQGRQDEVRASLLDIKQQMVDYFAVGGFYQVTETGRMWQHPRTGQHVSFDFDGGLKRIYDVVTDENLERRYKLTRTDDVLQLVKDLYTLRAVFTVYQGLELVDGEPMAGVKFEERPCAGNGLVSYHEYPKLQSAIYQTLGIK